MIVPAFIIKNFTPLSCKVQIIHQQHGKIMCLYSQKHQARQLTTGAIILCSVEPISHLYQFEYLEMVQSTTSVDLDHLQFIHEIMKICLNLLPDHVAVQDVFDFLMYVYQNIDTLPTTGRKIVLLRLFLLCEVLPETLEVYQKAMQDPFSQTVQHCAKLNHYLQIGWHAVAKQKENNF